MKKITKRILITTSIILLFGVVVFGVFQFFAPSPCFSREYVEDYVSKYSKDFTYMRNQTYSIGINGFEESDETDWYFYDNELDFEFHVKTLKSEISGGKHIACNYYDAYIEKFINEKGSEIEQLILDMFIEIYDMEKDDIYFKDVFNKMIIVIESQENVNFSEERRSELRKMASKKIFELLEQYDSNLKNRNLIIGWDVDLNTDWSDTNEDFYISIDGEGFKIKDYYDNK